MHQIPTFFKEEFCKALEFESSNFIKFNSSSKSSSKRFLTSKLIGSPKKKSMNTISTNENTGIYSIKHNYCNKKRDSNNNNYKSICRKLDFSDNSVSNNNNSNYSFSDNDNIEINEDCSEDSNEIKNLDYSSCSFEGRTTKKKSKTFNNKKNDYNEKEFNFMKKKKFSENLLFYSNNSKFDEEYIIIKTLCNGEMGTVYLCLRIKDKKKYVVKISKFFSRKLDYDNMNSFSNDISVHSNEPGSIFIQKYIDFWIEDVYEKTKSTANIKNMYIVTEYCNNGNLKEYMSHIKRYSNIKLTYSFYWDIIFQMIIPINFLHKLGYIHFDIKPTNYLVMNNNQLLLNDFCLSIKEENIGNISTGELEGDSIYISPELFYKDIGIITHKIDNFSLGLSILELLIDIDLPKNGPIWQEIRNNGIPKDYLDKIPLINNDFQNRSKLIELIIDLTQINSILRPELETLLNDKNKYIELYNRYQMLKNNDYLAHIFLNDINTNNFSDDYKHFEEEKEDSSIINESSDNINTIFCKRSNSMKRITESSSPKSKVLSM